MSRFCVVLAAVLMLSGTVVVAGEIGEVPSELADFYRLGDGEIVRVVQPPFPATRMAYYQSMRSDGGIPGGPDRMVFVVEDDGRLAHRMNAYGPAVLGSLLSALAFDRAAVDADAGLLELPTPGDVVYAAGSSRPALAEELQALLVGQFGLPVRLEYRTDAQTVVVAQGSYDLKPLSLDDPHGPRVHSFVDQPSEDLSRSAGAGTGDLSSFLNAFGSHLGVTIVNEASSEGPPVSWRFDGSSYETIHLERVLALVGSQTGLEFAVETRPNEVLYVLSTE